MDLLREEMVRYKQKTKSALIIFTFNLLLTEHWILQLVFFFNGFVYSLLPSERK